MEERGIPEIGFYLKVATQGVHSQDFGDELVVLNLNTGKYYSLRGGAVPIWNFLKDYPGYDSEFIARKGPFDAKLTDLHKFISQLHQEGLLVESEKAAEVDSLHQESSKPALEEISFEIFEDMQSLLLLDPIHDVDAKVGWPKQK